MENTEVRMEIIKRIIEKIIIIKEIDRLERIEKYVSYLYRKK